MENSDFLFSGGLDAESSVRLAHSLNTDIIDLNISLRSEIHAPEILPFKMELVDSVLGALKNQKKFIDQKFDQATSRSIFTVNLYEMDILRVKYTLTKYLRTRLLKIEDQCDAIVVLEDLLSCSLSSDLELFDRLSYSEKAFLGKLTEINKSYLEDTLYRRLDSEIAEVFQKSDDIAQHAMPRVKDFVFCRVLRDCSGIEVGRDVVENFRAGDIQIVRYNAVRDHVLDGSIELI